NVFRARPYAPDQDGKAGGDGEEAAVGYIRPHEVKLLRFDTGTASVRVTVRRVYAMGPLVRVELQRKDTGELFFAEMARERFEELQVSVDESLYADVGPLRYFSA